MIISITGKPHTKTNEIADAFAEKYSFEQLCPGNLFRKTANDNNMTLPEFCSSKLAEKYDFEIEKYLINVYQTMFDEDVLVESKTAFSFMPNAFNVFVDTDKKFSQNPSDEEELLNTIDCKRFKKLYNIDCQNLSNYTFVIKNTNLTTQQIADKIYEAYVDFLNK